MTENPPANTPPVDRPPARERPADTMSADNLITEDPNIDQRWNRAVVGLLLSMFCASAAAVAGVTALGKEVFDIEGLGQITQGAKVTVSAKAADGTVKKFTTLARIDTPNEVEYFRHGGILPYVLRQALQKG